MTFFRIIHETLGGHVHMRVFCGKGGLSSELALAGNLCMHEEEFADFKKYLGDQADFIERKSDVKSS